MWQPTPCCIGPVWDATTNEEVFLCSICDCKHPAVVEELGEPEKPWYLVERDCVYKRIAATYPDKQGSRTKVGYKQDVDRHDR